MQNNGEYPSFDNEDAYKNLVLLQSTMMKIDKKTKNMENINFFISPDQPINYDGFPRYYQAFYVLNGISLKDAVLKTIDILKDSIKIFIHNK